MPVTTTKAAQVEDALITALKSRAGLTGVQVEAGPLGVKESEPEYIQTVGEPATLSGSQEWGSIGAHRKEETCQILCEIYVRKPGAGATVLRAARDRALELMAEIEALLRDEMKNRTKLDGLVTFVQLVSWEERRGATEGNRISIIECTIQYQATLPTS